MPAKRGRPRQIEKAELPLKDGSTIILRLVGDGKTAQIELPDQWTLQSFDRSEVADSGRTRVAYTMTTRRGKARGAAAPKAATGTKTTATATAKKATTTRKPAAKRTTTARKKAAA
jgi:hypothetical protein